MAKAEETSYANRERLSSFTYGTCFDHDNVMQHQATTREAILLTLRLQVCNTIDYFDTASDHSRLLQHSRVANALILLQPYSLQTSNMARTKATGTKRTREDDSDGEPNRERDEPLPKRVE